MNLDRALIKKQAKQLNKGCAAMLFLVSIVVSILCSVGSFANTIYTDLTDNTLESILSGDYFDFDDNDADKDSSSNSNSYNKNYFDSFSGNVTPTSYSKSFSSSIDKDELISFGISLLQILELFMLPLTISIWGIYLSLIRGNLSNSTSFFGYVFKNAFDKNYWRKLWCAIIQYVVIAFMTILFIIPGIIFYYKYYFVNTIMADNPNVKASQAIKISKKITADHKGELFALDLSFIGWFILTILTCGILSIYALPYYLTTKALYYENFRIRALQEGRITAVDFMSEEEKMNFYYQSQYANNGQQYYQPPYNNNSQNFGSGENNDYYNSNY